MNATSSYELTIIVPVFNEQDNLQRVEQAMADFLPNATVRACVLLVNDGSKDNSLALIRDICSRQKDFFYISSAENHGLSTALKAGIDVTESRLIGYIDADLQTNPEDFNLLLTFADDYSLVAGIRAKRKDSGFKKLQSRIANAFRRFMTGDTATDTGCPLKVMHTDIAKRIPFFNGMHRFLAALINLEGGSYKEMPVRSYPRVAGVSKYHLWNRLKGPFVDCIAFRWWLRSRYIRYSINEQDL